MGLWSTVAGVGAAFLSCSAALWVGGASPGGPSATGVMNFTPFLLGDIPLTATGTYRISLTPFFADGSLLCF